MSKIINIPNPDLKEVNTLVGKIIYVLYLAGLLFGITALIGVVVAYVYRDKSTNPEWLNTHYAFQIRTFWYGLIYLILGSILTFILIGWVLLLWFALWIIVRSVKGFSALDEKQGIPNTTSFWGFGFK